MKNAYKSHHVSVGHVITMKRWNGNNNIQKELQVDIKQK